jgi:hypothetical protein
MSIEFKFGQNPTKIIEFVMSLNFSCVETIFRLISNILTKALLGIFAVLKGIL